MDLLEKIASDYRAEVIAAQMLHEDTDFSKIIIERLGNLARTYTRDVYGLYEETGKVDLDKYTVLQSFRQSIYEAIPESIFHPPTLGGLGKSTEEIIEQIRLQRKAEQEARTFFKPFEQEAPYLEIYGLMVELMFEKKTTYDNLLQLFQQAWPLIGKLPKDIALSFIYILPILGDARGKKEWMEQCLSFITDCKVTIQEHYQPIAIEKGLAGMTTGSSVLGISTILGGTQYDGYAAWEVVIGPVPYGRMAQVLPGSGFDELVDTLLEYMAPANIFIRKKIVANKEEPVRLSNATQSARLGYTFII